MNIIISSKKFYSTGPVAIGKLPPFHSNTVTLCYKAISPLNGSKLPR